MDANWIIIGLAVITWVGFAAMWYFLEQHKKAMAEHNQAMRETTEATIMIVSRMEETIYNMKQM